MLYITCAAPPALVRRVPRESSTGAPMKNTKSLHMPDPQAPDSLLHMSIGGAIAVCGVCFTFLGAFIGWIRIFHGPGSRPNPGSEQEAYIRRGEWDQACQASNRQYDQIAETLERLENKYDENSRWVQRVIQDLEKRVGIIEARHRDLTGDSIGPDIARTPKGDGEVMGFRGEGDPRRVEEPLESEPERRTGKHQDTGRRRRNTDGK